MIELEHINHKIQNILIYIKELKTPLPLSGWGIGRMNLEPPPEDAFKDINQK